MNKTVSAIGGLFVILVAVVFIVNFRPGAGAQQVASGPTCAIEVHGSCIPTTHYWAAYRLAADRYVDQARSKQMGLRRIIADALIERFILNEDAKRLGITVSEDEVTKELAKGRAFVSLPADKEREMGYYLGLLGPQPQRIEWEVPFRAMQVKSAKTKAFDLKQYEKTVRTMTKLSVEDFRDFQRQELIAARMRDVIRSRVHVAESEGYNEYSKMKSTATLSYVKLDASFYNDLFVDQSQKAVDEWAAKNADSINKQYESRKSQYEGECRVSRHILAKVSEDASEADKAKAKKRIDKALELVNKGEDFGAVAKRFSEEPGAETRGGDLGCVPKKQMVPEFEKALFEMEEGKVSGVVTTQFGLHIIQLQKIAKGDAVEKTLKAQIARELYQKATADALAAEAAKSIHAAVKGGKSLEDALKTHLEELAAKLPKDDKKDEKKADKKDEKADKKDDKKAEDEIVENKLPTIETHSERPIVTSSTPFNASGNPIPEAMSTTELVKQAFALQKPGDVLNDPVQLRDGYAVVTLKEKAPVKKEDWEKDRDQILSQIRTAKQIDALTLYIARARSKIESESPIKRNESITSEPVDEKGSEPDPGEDPGE
ncbi:MAG: peptidylprolyl isomerase [Polyangiaceae bacterium]